MQVHWVKCGSGGEVWCSFEEVNLESVNVQGVYVIWRSSGQTVYVGQGDVATRIREHRRNHEITNYSPMNVTWAAVGVYQCDGVERYLADTLGPLIGTHPIAVPIPVNLPRS